MSTPHVTYGSGVNSGYSTSSPLLNKSDSYQTSRAFWDRDRLQSIATKAIRQAGIAFMLCTALSAIPFTPTALIIANPLGIAAFVLVAKLIHTTLMPIWLILKAFALTVIGNPIHKAIDFFASDPVVNKICLGANFAFESTISRVVCNRIMPLLNRHHININTALLPTVVDGVIKGTVLLSAVEIIDWMLCKGYSNLCAFVGDHYSAYKSGMPDTSFLSRTATGIQEAAEHRAGAALSVDVGGKQLTGSIGIGNAAHERTGLGVSVVKDNKAHKAGMGDKSVAQRATEAARATTES